MKALLVTLVLAAQPGYLTAPVYTYVAENILQRTGTYTYKAEDGYIALYCVAHPPSLTVSCVVSTPSNRLILVDVPATEVST